MFEIKSHWNAALSTLNGKTFGTKAEAFDALGADGLVVVPFDAEGAAWSLYGSQEDADRDAEGAAPHLAVAAVYEVRTPGEVTF